MLAGLRRIMRGELRAVTPQHVTVASSVTPETPRVTPVTPVTANSDEKGNANSQGETAAYRPRPDADEAATEERAGLAEDRVPLVYLDAWARLNRQKPEGVSEGRWRQALDDGGRFLDAWGGQAAELGWTVGSLFDVTAGLVWRLAGESVEAVGADHARLSDGPVILLKDQ